MSSKLSHLLLEDRGKGVTDILQSICNNYYSVKFENATEPVEFNVVTSQLHYTVE